MNIIKCTRQYRGPFRDINNSGLFKFVRTSKKSLFSHSMMLCEWGLEKPKLVQYMIDDGSKEDDTESPIRSWN